jgi:hypothetical protein
MSMASWTIVLSRHTVFTIGVIYKFTLVWYSPKQGTTHIPTSHPAHLYTLSFLWLQEQTAAQLGTWFHWAVFVMVTLWVIKHFPSAPDSEWVTANRIAHGFRFQFDFFFQPSFRHPQWSALFRILCMTAQLQKCKATEIRTSSTVRAKQILSYYVILYKIPAFRECPKRFW